MVNILQSQYNIGWLNDDDLAWYVRNNAISSDDFKYITGSTYNTGNTATDNKK